MSCQGFVFFAHIGKTWSFKGAEFQSASRSIGTSTCDGGMEWSLGRTDDRMEWWYYVMWIDSGQGWVLPPPFTMAERYPFSSIGYLDQAIGDLIQDGLEYRKEQGVAIASAPVVFQRDLYAIARLLGTWSDEPPGSSGDGASGQKKRKSEKATRTAGQGVQCAANLVLLSLFVRSLGWQWRTVLQTSGPSWPLSTSPSANASQVCHPYLGHKIPCYMAHGKVVKTRDACGSRGTTAGGHWDAACSLPRRKEQSASSLEKSSRLENLQSEGSSRGLMELVPRSQARSSGDPWGVYLALQTEAC